IGQFAANDGINFGKLFTAGAVGALTAGIANGVTVGADGSLGAAVDWSQKVADNSLAGLAGAQSVPGTTMTQAAGSTASNLAQRVEAILVLSGANAAVNTVAYGGSFGRAFVSGLAANVAAAGAYAIGGALPGIGATGATPGSIAANIAMHGLLGCAAQSVINGNCAGGAAGAMTSAIVAPLLRDALYGDTQTAFPNADGSVIDAYRNPVFNMVAVALSSMAGGAVANALGASATAGAAAAQNEALNNATADHTRPWDIIAAVFNKLTGGTYLINGGKAFFNTGADVIEAGAKAVFAGMRDATAPPPPGTPDDLGGNGPGTAGGGAVQVTGGSPAVCWEPPVCQPGTPPVVGGGYRPGGGSSPVIASEGNAGSSGSVNSGAAAGAANTGNVSIEPGASPDPNELRAGQGLAGLGYDVAHQPTASSQGISNVRTADLSVRGVGQVDVYTPESGTSTNAIIRAIEKKADQATGVFVQADLSSADMASIAARTWGKPNAKSIQTLFFQRQDGTIVRFNRPVSGG
ncbi:hemagglutinin, partial [Ralstonia solanacearum]